MDHMTTARRAATTGTPGKKNGPVPSLRSHGLASLAIRDAGQLDHIYRYEFIAFIRERRVEVVFDANMCITVKWLTKKKKKKIITVK